MTSLCLPNHGWPSRADMSPMTYDSHRWWTSPAGGAAAAAAAALTSPSVAANGAERSHYSNYWSNQYYGSSGKTAVAAAAAADLSTGGGLGLGCGGSGVGSFYSPFPVTSYPLTSHAQFDSHGGASSSNVVVGGGAGNGVPTSSCQFYGAPVHPAAAAAAAAACLPFGSASQVHGLMGSSSDGCSSVGSTPSPVADRGYFKTAADSCGSLISPMTSRKKRRPYSRYQLVVLEKAFVDSTYITRQTRWELACKLALSERQVKVWFQNRRMKSKRIESRAPTLVKSSST